MSDFGFAAAMYWMPRFSNCSRGHLGTERWLTFADSVEDDDAVAGRGFGVRYREGHRLVCDLRCPEPPRLRGADRSPLGIVVLISRSACGAALPLGIGCCLSSPCMKALS